MKLLMDFVSTHNGGDIQQEIFLFYSMLDVDLRLGIF